MLVTLGLDSLVSICSSHRGKHRGICAKTINLSRCGFTGWDQKETYPKGAHFNLQICVCRMQIDFDFTFLGEGPLVVRWNHEFSSFLTSVCRHGEHNDSTARFFPGTETQENADRVRSVQSFLRLGTHHVHQGKYRTAQRCSCRLQMIFVTTASVEVADGRGRKTYASWCRVLVPVTRNQRVTSSSRSRQRPLLHGRLQKSFVPEGLLPVGGLNSSIAGENLSGLPLPGTTSHQKPT